jgi:hypothetical protein
MKCRVLAGRQRDRGRITHSAQTGSEARPAFYPISIVGLFPGKVKRPEREAVHSPPYIIAVKNTWIYTSVIYFRFQMVTHVAIFGHCQF